MFAPQEQTWQKQPESFSLALRRQAALPQLLSLPMATVGVQGYLSACSLLTPGDADSWLFPLYEAKHGDMKGWVTRPLPLVDWVALGWLFNFSERSFFLIWKTW